LQDGISLAAAERRTATIYLWGYAAEMTLKATYFSLQGFAEDQTITLADLRAARAAGIALGMTWTGNLHDLFAWANLLVRTRSATPGIAYPDALFATQVVQTARRLHNGWSETLRYRKNVAYAYEVQHAREAVQWLVTQMMAL
jgi:hypothetical protein